MKVFFAINAVLLISPLTLSANSKEGKKKLNLDNDADLERLLDQWEEDEDPIPPDELPDGHPDKPQPQVDFSKLDMKDPEGVMKMTKKGKTVMMFVRVSGASSRAETEEITSLWQTGLWNNHVQAERYVLEDDRVMFMFRDGSAAWEAKDFLIEQERCNDVQLEQQTYYGKHTKEYKEEIKKKSKASKKAKKSKKSKEEL